MNYFAHALPWLDRSPYLVAGTAVPDWLAVSDRSVRMRSKLVAPWIDSEDRQLAELARGMLQHLADDALFHDNRAFVELNLALIVQTRDFFGGERGFRPSLLGHLLVEVLLDAHLVEGHPAELERYHAIIDAVDPPTIQAAVNRMGRRPAERLATFIGLFRRERILLDYPDDGRLLVRLNQVMRRVRCEPLPDSFADLLPGMRRQVSARAGELLAGIPAAI